MLKYLDVFLRRNMTFCHVMFVILYRICYNVPRNVLHLLKFGQFSAMSYQMLRKLVSNIPCANMKIFTI